MAYSNADAAAIFNEIADLLEVQGGNAFRVRAYRNAARTLGDPLQFWRVCDANNAMNPPELTEEAGRALRVPVPQVRP